MDVSIACVCPGAPHERDTITLRDRLDFRSAIALRNVAVNARVNDPGISTEEIMAILTEGYLLHGVESWTIVDDRGKAIPVSRATIQDRLLAHVMEASEVGNAADTLYAMATIIPLVIAASDYSPPTPIDESTSATSAGPSTSRKRSRRSSTSTIPTAGIAKTSGLLDGVSSSSPS